MDTHILKYPSSMPSTNRLTSGSSSTSGDGHGITLSRYLEEEPSVMERLLFTLPKEQITVQQSSSNPVSDNKAATSDDANGIELAGGDFMEELNAIVAETSRNEE
jgi:hypothetical protein